MWEGGGPTVEDLSGNGNAGVITGGVWQPSKFGSGILFDGVSGDINCGSKPSIDDLALGSFSIVTLINPATIGENNTGRIASKRPISTNGGWLFFTDSVSSLGAQVIGGGGAVDAEVRGADNALTLGVYNHVVLTYILSSKTLHIYVNGIEISYDTNNAGTLGGGTDTDGVLMIGNTSSGGDSRTFDGIFDHLTIYNRALSPSEVALLSRESFYGFGWASIEQLMAYYEAVAVGGIMTTNTGYWGAL